LYEKTRTASFILSRAPSISIDLVTARSEKYPYPGSAPVILADSLHADLLRRDFSINAIACSASCYVDWLQGSCLQPDFVDPTGGVGDLELRRIRVLHEHSFTDDPTRIIRAIRYQSKIDGTIEPNTYDLMSAAVAQSALSHSSPARVVGELLRVLDSSVWLGSYWSNLKFSRCLHTWNRVDSADRLFDALECLQTFASLYPHLQRYFGLSLILRIFAEPEKIALTLNLPKGDRKAVLKAAQSQEYFENGFGPELEELHRKRVTKE
jgi:hypothetical protein